MRDKEELKAIREVQKRLSWIENVKRIYGWGQERAEKEWTKIFQINKPDERMTLIELIRTTGELPNNAITENGERVEVDVARNGKLGYIATLWQIKGFNVKEHIIDYGTGSTPEAAKEALKNKLLKY